MAFCELIQVSSASQEIFEKTVENNELISLSHNHWSQQKSDEKKSDCSLEMRTKNVINLNNYILKSTIGELFKNDFT